MALPKILHPTFDLIIPSTKQKISFRPFTVKEEKIILIAQTAEDVDSKVDAIKQLISNCITENEVIYIRTTLNLSEDIKSQIDSEVAPLLEQLNQAKGLKKEGIRVKIRAVINKYKPDSNMPVFSIGSSQETGDYRSSLFFLLLAILLAR